MNDAPRPFASALSLKADWRANAEELASHLRDAEGRLGVLYTAEPFAARLDEMTTILKETTAAQDWVAAAGYGVIAAGAEHFGENGAAALVLDLDADDYRLFSGDQNTGTAIAERDADWIAEAAMPLALTHLDPRHPQALEAVENLAEATNGFLVGGLTAASGETPHRAGGTGGCLSGVAISPMAVEISTGLSQGCTPLTEPHTVTRSEDNILIELNGRPALEVFKEDIGPELAADLQRCAGVIFAALPVPGSDTADYTVRNLVGIDPQQNLVAIAHHLEDGEQVLFCRRDRETAVEDMRRMAEDLKQRVGNRPIRGGIYVSCAARGPNQFAAPDRETDIIRETLGEFPMTGFFANGELSRDRIYAYTGVLTLFL